MFVDNFENTFEGLGLLKRPLAYNNEVLNNFIKIVFAYDLFIQVILYNTNHGSKYSPF